MYLFFFFNLHTILVVFRRTDRRVIFCKNTEEYRRLAALWLSYSARVWLHVNTKSGVKLTQTIDYVTYAKTYIYKEHNVIKIWGITWWNELYLKVGLEAPTQKKQQRKLGKKNSEKKVQIGIDLYKVQIQGRSEKNSSTLPYYRTMASPSLASNAMHASLFHFVL